MNSALIYLSGPKRGHTVWLQGDTLHLGKTAAHDLPLPHRRDSSQPADIGHLRRRGDSYELIVAPGARVWVNGEAVESMVLANGDLLELDEGVVIRFRNYRHARGAHKSMIDAFKDCIDCARRQPGNLLQKTGVFLASGAREFSSQISPQARTVIIVSMLGLAAAVGGLWHQHLELQGNLAREEARLEQLQAVVNGLSPDPGVHDPGLEVQSQQGDLQAIRSRLQRLEDQAGAPARIIERAGESVLLVAQVYEFANTGDGRLLREKGRDSGSAYTGFSRRQLTLEENYPPVRISYIGTAFFIDDNGHLLTNRHVAMPLLYEQRVAELCNYGYRPLRRHFVGFGHGGQRMLELEVQVVADEADLAILGTRQPAAAGFPALTLNPQSPQPGDGVILMGYPTGVRALLARTGEQGIQRFVDDMQQAPTLWDLLMRMARAELIHPLATQGIVGHVSDTALVYDAQTAQGGSGGPVLNLEGKVVGVNRAVVPEFGGSNIGVPLTEVRAFLEGLSERGRLAGEALPPDAAYPPDHPCAPPRRAGQITPRTDSIAPRVRYRATRGRRFIRPPSPVRTVRTLRPAG